MRKAYKYRIYPNDEQKAQLAKMFGCCRFVYNQTLAYRKEHLEKGQKFFTVKDCVDHYHRTLKKTNPWLEEADESALIHAIYQMDLAYRQAFKDHGGFPKFKRKRDSHKSYTITIPKETVVIDFTNHRIKLPSLPAIKAVLHRSFNGQITSATVSQSWSGKYYVSFVVEAAHQDIPHTSKKAGLNLRNNISCVTSDGNEYLYADFDNKHTKRLATLQKQLQRKEKGSNNYYKLKKEIALCHERITNTRMDDLHKISHKIISENQVIVFEILPHDSHSTESSSFMDEFQKLLVHKAKQNHRYYVKVDAHTTDRLLSHGNNTLHPQDVAKYILTAGLKQMA